MKKLCDCKWKAFVVGGLFNINIGKNLDKIHADMSGDKPYVTRTVSNNGVEGFVSAPDDMMTQEGPVITIGNETAQPFVQVFSFCTGRFKSGCEQILNLLSLTEKKICGIYRW